MKTQLFTKPYAKLALIILGALILLAVMLLKSGYIGTEAYHNVRLAENPALYDDLSFGGRFAAYSWGTPILLSPAPVILAFILPLLFGILSMILLSAIMKKLLISRKIQNLTLLLIAISPPFIYTFTSPNSLFAPFMISLLIFYLFLSERYKYWTIPLAFILPVFSVVISTVTLIMLFFYAFIEAKENRRLFVILLVANKIAAFLYYGFLLNMTGLSQTLNEQKGEMFSLFSALFFDLGSTYGLGLFWTILACAGIAFNWKNKYQNLFVFFAIPTLIIGTIFRIELILYLNLFVVVFAAYGYNKMVSLKWSSKDFKQFALFLIILGLSFSTISQISALIDAQPNHEVLKGIEFLETQEKGTVFADYTRGIWIAYSGHKNVWDENFLFIPDLNQREEDAQTLFYSRNLDKIQPIIEKYEIKYIWIDEEMKDSIWDHENEGLQFVAEYTNNFNKIYETDEVVIWRIDNV
jgi:hypothetical protein